MSLIVAIVVLLILLCLVWMLPLPANVKNIAMVVILLLGVLWFFGGVR
jgi:hypothetical protein